MASPISHTLTGVSIYLCWSGRQQVEGPVGQRECAKESALFAVLANLPDCDFVFGWVTTGDPNTAHHQWTHSFLFAAVAALVLASIWKINPSLWKTWRLYFLLIVSHLLIDFLTGPKFGISSSCGQPLLWPATAIQFSSPLTLILGPQHHGDLRHLLSLHNWFWGTYELLIFGLFTLLTVRLNSRRRRSPAATGTPSQPCRRNVLDARN